jgi:ketosteroid isomerase-like protein
MASANMETFLRLHSQADTKDDLTSERSETAMIDAFHADIEVIEPPSLPHGGVHRGIEAWQAMHHKMRDTWDQKVEVLHAWDVPDSDVIVVQTDMDWTAKATGKRVRFLAIEVLHFRDSKIAKVEIYLQDTHQILETLA